MMRALIALLLALAIVAAGCSTGMTNTPAPGVSAAPTPTVKLTPAPTTAPTPAPTPVPTPASTAKPPLTWPAAPPMTIDTTKHYTAIIETVKGNLTLELFAADVPVTVNNFVFLARQGYYDNTTFHRVITDFMAQGGDPTGTGAGSPGYYIPNEITEHKHVAGALSMARTAIPDTNGSQFFICYTDQPGLDGGYSVFGQLTQGMDVLKKLTPRDPSKRPTYPGDKVIRIVIEES